ncbi:ergothioneine biosynthesis protein EgtC [Rhodococcus sp. NPDC058521]|uniref:ergothioneine biosynthesis protein EgtC n=1 Tax=Rhodococcus sp. NPDC058521 TaxID=3346536 RepID=UPI00365233C4
MCRHLGYVGPPCSVRDLLTFGSHSLVRQSWAPKDMRGGGTINADGYGVAWWGREGLGRYRSAQPVWADPPLRETLSHIHTGALIAAVRSATESMPVERSACAPFVDGRWAFSHNGVVRGWPNMMADLAAPISATDLSRLEAPTDSAALWLLLQHRLREQPPVRALASLVLDVDAAAPGSRLNLLLGNGEELWATAWDHSLSVLVDENLSIIASEPYDDDPNWKSVPDRHIVSVRPGHLIVTPLRTGDL